MAELTISIMKTGTAVVVMMGVHVYMCVGGGGGVQNTNCSTDLSEMKKK